MAPWLTPSCHQSTMAATCPANMASQLQIISSMLTTQEQIDQEAAQRTLLLPHGLKPCFYNGVKDLCQALNLICANKKQEFTVLVEEEV
jgi:hypothetical protein